jgi:hypothetical protein
LTSNGDGQSADGFGCHPDKAGNTGNIFIGCRAWWNSDDAWDFINSQEACTVRYSWAWYSGYKPDAIVNGQPVALAAGNGNGFKGGGYGDPQTGVPPVPPAHVIEQNCAFYNKANGLYANHEIVNPLFYNNTSFNNGTDLNMLGLNGTTVTSVGFLRNNLAYSNNGHGLLSNMTNGGPISDQYNSWDTSVNVTPTAADFQSVAFAPPASCPAPFSAGGTVCVPPSDTTSFAGMASARQADGSLPVLPFLRLAAQSPLIDKGTNVGLPYSGSEPDLGCFESGLAFDPGDGGTSSSSGGTASGGSSGGTSTSSSGADGSTMGGGSSTGGASGGASSGASGSGGSTTASGSTSSGASTGTSGGSTGSGSGATSDTDAAAETNAAMGQKSGCGCELIGARDPRSRGAWAVAGLLLVGLGLGRKRQ